MDTFVMVLLAVLAFIFVKMSIRQDAIMRHVKTSAWPGAQAKAREAGVFTAAGCTWLVAGAGLVIGICALWGGLDLGYWLALLGLR